MTKSVTLRIINVKLNNLRGCVHNNTRVIYSLRVHYCKLVPVKSKDEKKEEKKEKIHSNNLHCIPITKRLSNQSHGIVTKVNDAPITAHYHEPGSAKRTNQTQ